MRVVAIAGMAGAGKKIVSQAAEAMGCPIFSCGDVVRDETRNQGLPATPENVGKIMLTIREREGPTVVVKRLTPRIEACGAEVAVVEGVRSFDEIKELRKVFGSVTVIAVHASPATRFERLRARGRSDDPCNWSEFEVRDSRELKVGIGDVIVVADEMIVNEGTIDELLDQAGAVFQEMLYGSSDLDVC